MVLDLYNSARETRDNLGSQDENKNLILLGIFKETIGIEMGPTVLKRRNIMDAFVLGITTNAILGTTELGEDSIEEFNARRVVNPNNIFHEHFRFNTFVDTTLSTGTLSLTNFNMSMTKGQTYITNEIFKNIESLQFATIFPTTGTKTTISVDSEGGQAVTITEGS